MVYLSTLLYYFINSVIQVTSNGKMVCEQCIGKNVEGSGYVLFKVTISPFVWTD